MDAAMIETFTSPVILFFVLGMLAAFVRSDLVVPEALAKGMSLYLMAAIGLKGGVAVSESGVDTTVALALLAGVGASFLLPLIAFAVLRGFAKLDQLNSGAVAAHYGSVSVVTFVTAVEVYQLQGHQSSVHQSACGDQAHVQKEKAKHTFEARLEEGRNIFETARTANNADCKRTQQQHDRRVEKYLVQQFARPALVCSARLVDCPARQYQAGKNGRSFHRCHDCDHETAGRDPLQLIYFHGGNECHNAH